MLNVRSESHEFVANIFQQMIWMATALRVSKSECIQYSAFQLRSTKELEVSFNVSFSTLDLSEQEQSCWLSLFTNPVITRGFPIPDRDNQERGLEIPLEIWGLLVALGM